MNYNNSLGEKIVKENQNETGYSAISIATALAKLSKGNEPFLISEKKKGERKHNSLGEKIVIEEQLDYNKADNTADIVWDFINKNTNQIQTFNFQIMIHFPDTIMNLIQDNGF